VNSPPNDLSIGIYAGQSLGPAIERGELTAKSLENFWQYASWHYRFEMNGGYPVDSPWMLQMYKEHGEDYVRPY
jgi:hypothetical protein